MNDDASTETLQEENRLLKRQVRDHEWLARLYKYYWPVWMVWIVTMFTENELEAIFHLSAGTIHTWVVIPCRAAVLANIMLIFWLLFDGYRCNKKMIELRDPRRVRL
ncbi:hypothetical protein [Xanthomonas phage RTH11]|nr:hypothetical protein [Xanthomonas phage RTH11]